MNFRLNLLVTRWQTHTILKLDTLQNIYKISNKDFILQYLLLHHFKCKINGIKAKLWLSHMTTYHQLLKLNCILCLNCKFLQKYEQFCRIKCSTILKWSTSSNALCNPPSPQASLIVPDVSVFYLFSPKVWLNLLFLNISRHFYTIVHNLIKLYNIISKKILMVKKRQRYWLLSFLLKCPN